MRLLFAVVSTCLALVLPWAAWAKGAVYGMTNALGQNQIVVWARAADGTLSYMQTVNTGGGGSGAQVDGTDSLGSQGSIVLDRQHQHLYAVNTNNLAANELINGQPDCAMGSISSFLIAPDGTLSLAATVSSGGLFPNSVTVRGNLLYVLNAGGPSNCGIGPNITGFKVSPDGTMTPLSTQAIDPVGSSPGTPLDCDNTGVPPCGLNPPLFVRSPAQIGFTPNGDSLIVTVKGTNTIYQFPVRGLGKLGPANVWKAQGPTQPTYFGFSFDKEGHLIVTEPFGASTTIPAGGASSVSSFTMRKNSGLSPISLDVPNGQTASCWVAIEPFTKRYAYISNNISSTISVYSIADDGSLTKLAPIAAANHPNDLAVATDSGASFLYVLNSGAGTVGAFAINADGSLTSLGESGGLPADAGAQGLAAY